MDGGATFSAATGTNSWSFNWTPSFTGPATIKSRAVDSSRKSAESSGGNSRHGPGYDAADFDNHFPNSRSDCINHNHGHHYWDCERHRRWVGGRVEVSVDGGATYSAATGTNAWSFNWTPATPGPATIKSRAVDDSGNQQDPPAEITVTSVPATIRVPSDQPTIQSAIDVANNGDTVLVAPRNLS